MKYLTLILLLGCMKFECPEIKHKFVYKDRVLIKSGFYKNVPGIVISRKALAGLCEYDDYEIEIGSGFYIRQPESNLIKLP